LRVHGRSAKTDACGRSFAVLSAQVSTAGLRPRHNKLACGIMLEVSRDAVAAREEKLASYVAKQSSLNLYSSSNLQTRTNTNPKGTEATVAR
jgi:hypothetical protein